MSSGRGPSMQGYLLKHPGKGFMRKYKKRWFVLEDLNVSYAKDDKTPPIKSIRCRDIISVTGVPGVPIKAKRKYNGCGFALHYESRAIVLLAESPVEREQWLQALGMAQQIDNGELPAASAGASPDAVGASAAPSSSGSTPTTSSPATDASGGTSGTAPASEQGASGGADNGDDVAAAAAGVANSAMGGSKYDLGKTSSIFSMKTSSSVIVISCRHTPA